MEAPEKLYVDVTDNPNDVWLRAFRQPFKKCGIEYTRTDVFIAKACKGIDHLLRGYIIRNFHFGDSYKIDTLIEDFKKYMEDRL